LEDSSLLSHIIKDQKFPFKDINKFAKYILIPIAICIFNSLHWILDVDVSNIIE